MTQFYFIDGPLKGSLQLSDFRQTYVTSGEIYYKYTFARRIDDSILYIDIASLDSNLRTLIVTEDMPFHIRTDSLVLNRLPPNGIPT